MPLRRAALLSRRKKEKIQCVRIRTPLPFHRQHTICRYPQEFNIEPHPFAHRLVKELPQVREGYLTVPDAPGLGVEVNEEVVAELCMN